MRFLFFYGVMWCVQCGMGYGVCVVGYGLWVMGLRFVTSYHIPQTSIPPDLTPLSLLE